MAEERGASPTEGALLISYASAASGIGRLLFGRMADCKRFSKFYIWRTGLLGMSVSSTLVIIARSYEWFVVYAFTFGLFEGCYVTLTPLLVRHIAGVRKFPYGLGMAYFSMSFTRSAGPPIAGWMYDSFHSYKMPFLYTGFVIFTGCFISFLVPLLQKRNTRTEPTTRVIYSLPESTERLMFKLQVAYTALKINFKKICFNSALAGSGNSPLSAKV